MATFYATPGVRTAFAGGANELECILADDTKSPINAPSMVQISCDGTTLNSATISARGFGSSTYDTIPFAEVRTVALIGEDGNQLSGVKIGGLGAGSYFFTFIAKNP